MSKQYFEPANSIIRLVGAEAIAAAAHVHVSRVYRWRQDKSKGGSGGLIPIEHIRAIMQVARERGIKLTADDFLPETNTNSPAVSRVSRRAGDECRGTTHPVSAPVTHSRG